MNLVGLVPSRHRAFVGSESFLVDVSWVRNFFSWVLRGFFVGPKFFHVGISWLLSGSSWFISTYQQTKNVRNLNWQKCNLKSLIFLSLILSFKSFTQNFTSWSLAYSTIHSNVNNNSNNVWQNLLYFLRPLFNDWNGKSSFISNTFHKTSEAIKYQTRGTIFNVFQIV